VGNNGPNGFCREPLGIKLNILVKVEDLVKSRKSSFFVIPAKAGIQSRLGGINRFQFGWTPVFTGVTTFYEIIKVKRNKNPQKKGERHALPKTYQILFGLFVNRGLSTIGCFCRRTAAACGYVRAPSK
jgi:hypothetical protein